MAGVLPADAPELLVSKLDALARASVDALGLSAAVALLVTWWGASGGVRTLMQALNVAYDVPERLRFVHRTALSLLLTLSAIIGGIAAIAASSRYRRCRSGAEPRLLVLNVSGADALTRPLRARAR